MNPTPYPQFLELLIGYLLCGIVGLFALLLIWKIANGSIDLTHLLSDDDGWASTSRFQLVRFTGQIFFDASHKPCSGGTGSPKRSAIWELHPVYKVEICLEPGNNCKVDSEENWADFSDRVGLEGSSETRLRLPDEVWGEIPFASGPRAQSRSPAANSARAPAL